MGIVEDILTEFRWKNKKCIVEMNENNLIHIHVGDLRIDMTPSEFREFVSVLKEARKEMERIKCLNQDLA